MAGRTQFALSCITNQAVIVKRFHALFFTMLCLDSVCTFGRLRTSHVSGRTHKAWSIGCSAFGRRAVASSRAGHQRGVPSTQIRCGSAVGLHATAAIAHIVLAHLSMRMPQAGTFIMRLGCNRSTVGMSNSGSRDEIAPSLRTHSICRFYIAVATDTRRRPDYLTTQLQPARGERAIIWRPLVLALQSGLRRQSTVFREFHCGAAGGMARVP